MCGYRNTFVELPLKDCLNFESAPLAIFVVRRDPRRRRSFHIVDPIDIIETVHARERGATGMAAFQFVIGVSGTAFGAQNEAGRRQLAIVETAMRGSFAAHNPIGAALMIDQTVRTKLGNGKETRPL